MHNSGGELSEPSVLHMANNFNSSCKGSLAAEVTVVSNVQTNIFFLIELFSVGLASLAQLHKAVL